MRIYVAGPMRGYDLYNFPAFDAASAFLRALGHDVVNPADLDRDQGINEHTTDLPDGFIQDALRRDFYEICTCDAIAFLPGWEASSGARSERYVGEKIGCKMYHVDPSTLSFKAEEPTLLVGISGYAQSGKDTSGGIMTELAGFERFAFADALKAVTLDCNQNVRTAVQSGGWEAVKQQHPTARIFLQHLGAAIRDHVAEDAWVNAVLRQVKPGGRYCVTDVRYENEAVAIKAAGGFVVRVERPGTGPANAHASETALDNYSFDAILRNNGTLEDLKRRVRIFLSTL